MDSGWVSTPFFAGKLSNLIYFGMDRIAGRIITHASHGDHQPLLYNLKRVPPFAPDSVGYHITEPKTKGGWMDSFTVTVSLKSVTFSYSVSKAARK